MWNMYVLFFSKGSGDSRGYETLGWKVAVRGYLWRHRLVDDKYQYFGIRRRFLDRQKGEREARMLLLSSTVLQCTDMIFTLHIFTYCILQVDRSLITWQHRPSCRSCGRSITDIRKSNWTSTECSGICCFCKRKNTLPLRWRSCRTGSCNWHRSTKVWTSSGEIGARWLAKLES